MTEELKGHCKHGEVNLVEGCPQCIAEARAERLAAEARAERLAAEAAQEAQIEQREIENELEIQEPKPDPMETLPAPLIMLQELGQVVEPGLLQIAQEAIRLRDFAVARVIATNEDLKPAVEDLSIIKRAKNLILEKKTEILAPFKSQVDGITAAFADLLQPLEEADRINRDKITVFDNQQKAAAAEAKRIEDEKFRLAQEEAAFKGGEITVELGTAIAPPPVPAHTRTALGTQGFTKVHKWEVVDFTAVPDQYKVIDAGKVTGVVKGSKGTIEIPGIRVWTDEAVTVRTK